MIQCSHIFLRKDDRFLFYLRDNKSSIAHPNYWALIGGQIETSETPLQALKREIKEEIYCSDIENIIFLDKILVRKDPLCYDHDIFLFKGDIMHNLNELQLSEGQRLEYFKFTEIKKLKVPSFLKGYFLGNREKIGY